MRTRLRAGALLAALALAMLCMLPRLNAMCVPPACLQPAPLLAHFRERSRQAPTGVLLIGALSNAGGLAFHA